MRCWTSVLILLGAVRFFEYRDVFFVVSRRPMSLPLLVSRSFLASRFCILLFSLYRSSSSVLINPCVLFWASTSCKLELKEDLDTEKKIEKSRYPKKTSRYQLKESPDFFRSLLCGNICRSHCRKARTENSRKVSAKRLLADLLFFTACLALFFAFLWPPIL